MARPKKVTTELRSIEDCTRKMGELLEVSAELEILNAERDLAMAGAQSKFESRIDAARSQKKAIEAALQAYYYEHLAELEDGERKHCKLPNGVMGRRFGAGKLTPLNRAWSWTAITVQVRELFGPTKFFRSTEPELDRQALKDKLDAEKLATVGLRIKNEERFYAEPDRPHVPHTQEAH